MADDPRVPSHSRPQSRARSSAPPAGVAPFFPRPYEGETLYSVVARYRRARKLDTVGLNIDLFGKDARVFSPTLPLSVARIADRAGIGRPGAEGLILQHTGYRYYVATAKQDRAAKLMAQLLDEHGKPVMFIGQRAAPAGVLPFMRFCGECLRRMSEEEGETYWRLVHQLPIVTMCPDHETILLESSVPGTGVIPGFEIPTTTNCPTDARQVVAPGSDRTMLAWLSNAAARIATGDIMVSTGWRGALLRELERRSLILHGRFQWGPINETINELLSPIADAFPRLALDPESNIDWADIELKGVRPSATDRVLMLSLALDLPL